MSLKNCNNLGAFLALVRAGLWGDGNLDIRINGTTDWQEVYQLATEQSVLGFVLAGLDHSDVKPPKELLLQWIGEVQMIEQRNKVMNAFIAELIEKLRKNGIYALLVKGQGVAQCYEKPLWRACGDIDLFLNDENYEKAKVFLAPFVTSVEDEYMREKHLGMIIDGQVVELHGRLYSGLSSRIERELDKVHQDTFFGGAVRSWNCEGVQVLLMKVENDVFYVFTHILQHFYKEGVGMRQMCDWCRLLWMYKDKLDLQLLELRIKRAGLMTVWKAFGAYAVDYLGLPFEAMPFYSSSKRWSRKAKRINKFIISVGNMGHNRDTSYNRKYPYLVRKCFSMKRRVIDLMNHARIFPKDSLFIFPYMIFNGVESAIRGKWLKGDR